MEKNTQQFNESMAGMLDILGLDEAPMGVYFTDVEPSDGISPKAQRPVSRELEEKGEIDWESVQENFACVLGVVWRARKKKVPAFFDKERFGCLGAAFYLGYLSPYLNMHPYFISTGIPGVLEGEKYTPSPESAKAFFDAVDPLPAPRRYCVIQPLSRFKGDEKPAVVTFFARPEVMSGLRGLVNYVAPQIDSFKSPFGPGCSGLVTWPLKYLKEGKEYAVLGSFDPSCRKFLKTDELTLSVSYTMFNNMVEQWEKSFLTTGTWKTVRKKIERSKKAWGEK